MTGLRCLDCRSYDDYGNGTGSGLCRRNPPVVSDAGTGWWPEVQSTDWCGEHRPDADPSDPSSRGGA